MNRTCIVAMCLVVATFSMPPDAAAQDDVVELKAGTPHEQKAGTQVDLFRLVAMVGTKVRVVATVPGSAVVTLYTPEGDAMLRSEGAGLASVEAYLPSSNAYIVSIVRDKTAKPYSVMYSEEMPTPAVAYVSQKIGYTLAGTYPETYMCWVEPGRRAKFVSAAATIFRSVVTGNRVSTEMGSSAPYDATLAFEANTLTATLQSSNGASSAVDANLGLSLIHI